ncbi:MAG: DNA polymerase ligase N-terminal domain-containing protein [Solirubrobacteraceae bacterium]
MQAIRATVTGGSGLRDEIARRGRELGLAGWVREGAEETVLVHAEGDSDPVAALVAFVRDRVAAPARVEVTPVRAEGHEQFAVRGVNAGVFVVQEHAATAHHFDFRLEVDGVMRSWAVPKGPSLDPAVKRFAVQVEDHDIAHNAFEGPTPRGGVIIWDQGSYEQGGRIAWPEAVERGHAVFVLHGEKLHGGFALQRTRAGPKAQWLLIKRRDDDARPGSDIAAQRPESVRSGLTLDEVIAQSA